MEQFIVSARKYRPATFESVVGQRSITTTLQNAIKNNHLAQAFLFCGPRGVGKTTCARILAREINISETGEDSDFAFNIFELDAASNNSVEDIRGLIDQVRIPPQIGKYKVYIIDEVHMLSAAAFNAFLKTLEEPPAHAIFILATTEKHKILATILSRCQIFDFQRISVEAMADHLQSIAQKENIQAEPDALHVIAQKADGGLRDALSIFDQVVIFSGNNLTYQAVITNLNILDHDYYFSLTDKIKAGDISGSLLTFNEILSKGFDGHNFLNGLASHFRNLLVASDPATLTLLEVGQNIRERYKEQSASVNAGFLTRGLNILSQADIQYKSSKQPRLLVEVTLMQLCTMNSPESAEKKNDTPVIIRRQPQEPQPQSDPLQPAAAAEIKPVEEPVAVNPTNTNQVPAPTLQVSETEPENLQKPDPTPEPDLKDNTPSQEKTPPRGIPMRRGISINAVKKEVLKPVMEGSNSDSAMPSGPEEPFTAEQFKSTWDGYVEKLKNEGKAQLAISLTMRPYELRDNSKVFLELDNAMQEEMLRSEQSEILEYLRNNLKNFKISLETRISETTANRRPYTNREKFTYLAEKYPELNQLRQQLGLDID